jgi:hypothetical protein
MSKKEQILDLVKDFIQEKEANKSWTPGRLDTIFRTLF